MTRRDLAAAVMADVLVLAALLVLAPQAATHATTPRSAQPVSGLVPWPDSAPRSGQEPMQGDPLSLETTEPPSPLPDPTGAPSASPLATLPDSSAKRRAPAGRQPAAQPSAAPTPHASPRVSARSGRSGSLVASGLASFMDPSYGALYLALPSGPGHRVLICAVDRCITRTSTDAGPDLAMQRAGRVADLSFSDFRLLCGDCNPWSVGLLAVEVRRP